MYIVGIDIANSHAGFLKKLDAPAAAWKQQDINLRQAGQTVHVINSSPMPCAFLRQTKNDTIDALIVAEVETQVASENIVALLELCRQRFFVVDIASDFKRKIIALLDQTFPEYEKFFSHTFGKSSVELLANCLPSTLKLSLTF